MEFVNNFEDFIAESRITVKRKYTDTHPEKTISSSGPIRERILQFVKEKKEVSRKELLEFLRGVNEESGKSSVSWLNKPRNLEYLQTKVREGEKYYTLSKVGERVHSALEKKSRVSVNEAMEVEKYSKEFTQLVSTMKNIADQWKKASEEEKPELMKTLKELTAKKREIEDKLDQAIANKDRAIELAMSED